MTSTVELVQAQVDAYNNRDTDAFAALYSEDASLITADGNVLVAGRAAIRDMYARLFSQSPDLHVSILARLSQGEWVVDEEQATGLQAEGLPSEIHALVVYQVTDGLIVKAQMFF